MSDILVDKMVVTRKKHKCWGCAETFPAGTNLRYLVNVDGGDFAASYWCKTCNEYWQRFMYCDDEINMGDLKSNDPDVWCKIHESLLMGGI